MDTKSPVITLTKQDEGSEDTTATVECCTEYEEPGATAKDVCDGSVGVVIDDTDVDTSETGEYTVRYTAEDGAGNTTEMTRTVVVVDTRKPVITMNGSDEVSVECKEDYSDAGATADDCCDGDLTERIATDESSVDTDVPGTYTVTYDVSDDSANAADTVTRTVIVEDTIPPEITLRGESSMTVECGDEFEDPGATAYDDCDGDVTDCGGTGSGVDPSQPGEYTIEYNATDSSGNEATEVIRTVTVVDTTPPVITLNGESSVTVECGEAYTDAGATATDVCDGDLTGSIVTVNLVNASEAGTYTVTYNVSDSSGNAATEVSREVTVILDTVAPEIELIGDSEVTIACGETYGDEGATATDDCDGDLTSNIRTKWKPEDTLPPDTHVLIYTVNDAAGNEATVTRTIIVDSPCDDEWAYTIHAKVVGAPDIAQMHGTVSETNKEIEECDYSWTISRITTDASVEASISTGLGICPVLIAADISDYHCDEEVPIYVLNKYILKIEGEGEVEIYNSDKVVEILRKNRANFTVEAHYTEVKLQLTVTPMKDVYHQGDQVTFEIEPKDPQQLTMVQSLVDNGYLAFSWRSNSKLTPSPPEDDKQFVYIANVANFGIIEVYVLFIINGGNWNYNRCLGQEIKSEERAIYRLFPVWNSKGRIGVEPSSSYGLDELYYYEDTTVDLTAEAVNSDWRFKEWRFENFEGGVPVIDENPPPTTVTMDNSKYVYIEFEENGPPWRLTCVYPSIAGRIQIVPLPPPGQDKFAEGTEVTLKAINNQGYTFSYWWFNGTKNQYISSLTPYTFVMNQHYTVFANFISDTGTTVDLDYPTGESTRYINWSWRYDSGAGFYPVALFEMQLLPDQNFEGRIVKEFNNGVDQYYDGCFNEGVDPIDYELKKLSGGIWNVGSNNIWKYDNVGRSLAPIQYYRKAGRLGCKSTLWQYMYINSAIKDPGMEDPRPHIMPTMSKHYVTNVLEYIVVDYKNVEYRRGNGVNGYDSSGNILFY